MANQNTPLGAIQKFQIDTTIHTLLRSPIIGIFCIHLIGAEPKVEIGLTSQKIYPVENFLTIPKVTIDKAMDSFTIASNWLKEFLGKPDVAPRSLRPMLSQPLRVTPYSTELFHLLIYPFQGPKPTNQNLIWVDLATANSMCEDGRIIDLVTYFAIKMYILDRPNKI